MQRNSAHTDTAHHHVNSSKYKGQGTSCTLKYKIHANSHMVYTSKLKKLGVCIKVENLMTCRALSSRCKDSWHTYRCTHQKYKCLGYTRSSPSSHVCIKNAMVNDILIWSTHQKHKPHQQKCTKVDGILTLYMHQSTRIVLAADPT